MLPLDYVPSAVSVRSRWQFLIRHNPFYLISAMCMLAGCLALTNSLSWTSIQYSRLIALIVTLSCYEAILVGLGVFLIVRRGLYRDGMMLLLLEAVFLVDAAFLNIEVFAIDLRDGLIINAVLFLLAAAKLYVVFRGLRLNIGPRFIYILTALAALFILPGSFAVISRHHGGNISQTVTYAAWWMVGLLPALYLLTKIRDRDVWEPAFANPAVRRLVCTLLALPVISLIAHLCLLHWVYASPFFIGGLSPCLIGCVVALRAVEPSRTLSRRDIAILQVILPPVAVLFSIDAPEALCFSAGGTRGVEINPVLITTLAAYLTYVFVFLSRYAWYFVAGAAAALAALFVAPTPSQIASGMQAGWQSTWRVLYRLTPKTVVQWGVVAVAAAFVFLGIGAMLSLKADPATEEADD